MANSSKCSLNWLRPSSVVKPLEFNSTHLLLHSNSPHHPKKDMVELQSFYHHYHHTHQDNSKLSRPPNTGNYALPYDVLPVSRENSNVAIYGQRPTVGVNGQVSLSNQQMPEPLYATTKPIAGYNHYCQKVSSVKCLSTRIAFQFLLFVVA